MAAPHPVACCPPEAAAEAEERYPDDPTLDECCRRDIREQKQVAVLKATLLTFDTTNERIHIAQQVAAMPPPADSKPEEEDDTSWDGSDDDGDHVLEAMRSKRMEELKRMQELELKQTLNGVHALIDVRHADLLKRIEATEGCCVCHLSVEGFEPCAQLDEHLAVLAYQNEGTAFLRSSVFKKSALKEAFQIDFLPALLSFKDGCLVGRTPLSQFGNMSDILEEQVTAYLHRLGVLRKQLKSKAVNQGRVDSSDEEEEEEEEKQEQLDKPCEICGRMYAHEHVKAIWRDPCQLDDGSDEDS
eukprot:gene18729-25260_t